MRIRKLAFLKLRKEFIRSEIPVLERTNECGALIAIGTGLACGEGLSGKALQESGAKPYKRKAMKAKTMKRRSKTAVQHLEPSRAT